MVLERIKRKADRAIASHDMCEEGTRASVDNEEKDDGLGDQENGFTIDAVEETTHSASIPKDILKRLEVSDSYIYKQRSA